MRRYSWLLLLIILAVSCNKEKEFDYPLIYTGEVTDIKNDGAVFSAKIVDLSKLEIIEYGFVWDNKTNPTIEGSEKYIISEPPKIGVFNQQISTTLRAGVKYYVRTYIRNTKFTTYGKEVVFMSLGSLAPQIVDFIPKTGNLKDTLTIIGRNFSYKASSNQVQIGEFQATVIKASQDTLVVKVPEKLNALASSVSVSILGNKVIAANKFNLIPPVINDFSEKVATFGSQVSISGNNFLANPSSLQVYFDNYKCTIVGLQNQSIVVIVPDSLNTRKSNIKVKMNNIIVSSSEQFQLAPLSINDFSPKVALTGSTITLTGNNFSPILKNNIVKIGGLNATILNATIDKLDVKVPLQDIGYYPSRNVSVNVEVIGEKHDFSETLLVNDKWFRHKDSPIDFSGVFYTLSDNKGYFGINDGKGFWEYDPLADEFIQLSNFPGSVRSGGNGFAINSKIYFGTGYSSYANLNDFWEYDVASNSWVQKNNFAGNSRNGSTTFSINEYGYLGGGVYSQQFIYNHPFDDFWKYDLTSDTWSSIPSFMGSYSGSVNGMAGGISVVVDKIAYIGMGWNYSSSSSGEDERWFSYNSEENIWKQLTNFPYSRNYQKAIAFSLNGVPYVKTVESDFYAYDSSSNLWQKIETGLLPRNISGIGFSIGSKAYIGIKKAFWEYDPSR